MFLNVTVQLTIGYCWQHRSKPPKVCLNDWSYFLTLGSYTGCVVQGMLNVFLEEWSIENGRNPLVDYQNRRCRATQSHSSHSCNGQTIALWLHGCKRYLCFAPSLLKHLLLFTFSDCRTFILDQFSNARVSRHSLLLFIWQVKHVFCLNHMTS